MPHKQGHLLRRSDRRLPATCPRPRLRISSRPAARATTRCTRRRTTFLRRLHPRTRCTATTVTPRDARDMNMESPTSMPLPGLTMHQASTGQGSKSFTLPASSRLLLSSRAPLRMDGYRYKVMTITGASEVWPLTSWRRGCRILARRSLCKSLELGRVIRGSGTVSRPFAISFALTLVYVTSQLPLLYLRLPTTTSIRNPSSLSFAVLTSRGRELMNWSTNSGYLRRPSQ